MNQTNDAVSRRLAVYGSLAPGGANSAVLDAVRGQWQTGWVEGVLHAEGWGATEGYPGMVHREGADRIPVQVLESDDLPAHWSRLDAFEGPDYRRVIVPVHGLPGCDEPVEANLYEVKTTS